MWYLRGRGSRNDTFLQISLCEAIPRFVYFRSRRAREWFFGFFVRLEGGELGERMLHALLGPCEECGNFRREHRLMSRAG
jgi:hypothetical protein